MKLKNVFENIIKDLDIDRKMNNRLPNKLDFLRTLLVPQLCSLAIYRFSRYFYVRNFKMLAKIMRNANLILFSIDIQPEASIEGGCFIGHTVGVVIGPNVIIEKGCLIFHCVTITPGKNPGERLGKDDVLRVGKNAKFFAGAKVLGKISIGDNVTVGANSVVLKSVPEGTTVAGIPARVIKKARKASLADLDL